MTMFKTFTCLATMFFTLLVSVGCTDIGCSRNVKDELTVKEVEQFVGFMKTNSLYKLGLIEDGVYVLNRLVFSTNDKVYATIPENSFISDYKRFLLDNQEDDWSEIEEVLPADLNLELFEAKTKQLADLGVTSVYRTNNDSLYIFQWGSSVMRGFCGLILGPKSEAEEYAKKFTYTEEVTKDVFYFEYR